MDRHRAPIGRGAEVLGWDPAAAGHNLDELATGMARGCEALVEEGHPPVDVVQFVADLRRATRVSWLAGVRRPEVFGDPVAARRQSGGSGGG